MSEKAKVIVVRKKVKGHGGHHGGSWKVAYADFVTAMMAFFLVMWIMGMDEGVKDMVQGYFSNPIGFRKSFSGGMNPLSSGTSMISPEVQRPIMLRREQEREVFRAVAQDMEAALAASGGLSELEAEVEVVVTDEGLRVEFMETGGVDVFFPRSSAELQTTLRAMLVRLAEQLRTLPNYVVVEGHTDGIQFPGQSYTNWELSADRANAARRALLEAGLDPGRIWEVRGHADRQPKVPQDLRDPRNRRITILLPFQEEISLDLVGMEALAGSPEA